MSFRTRLTTFFVLIVVVPMIAMGVLMFRLIGDSQQGKADARASGLASAAASLYQSEGAAARADAQALARAVGRSKSDAVATHFANLARRAGLARATLSTGSTVLADVGDNTAIAPGAALLKTPTAAQPMTVTVSELTASQYAHDLAAPGVVVTVHDGPRLLGSTNNLPAGRSLPANGNVTAGGTGYRAIAQTFRGFNGASVTITVLSALSVTSASIGRQPRRRCGADRRLPGAGTRLRLACLARSPIPAPGLPAGRPAPRQRRLLLAGDGRGPRRVRRPWRGVQPHVDRAVPSARRAVAGAGQAPGRNPAHWPYVRLEPRPCGAARGRTEDRGRCGPGKRGSAQRQICGRRAARRDGARGVAGRP